MAFDRGIFLRTCGMLASPDDREVVVAARAAQQMLEKAGLTWSEVIPALPDGPMTAWDRFERDHPVLMMWVLDNLGRHAEADRFFQQVADPDAQYELVAIQVDMLKLAVIAAQSSGHPLLRAPSQSLWEALWTRLKR
jgi:hypothetical protein